MRMPLRRAKQACLHCHRRRIRCDVLQQQPCANCVAQDVACEMGVSRRGKYPRKKQRQSTEVVASPVPTNEPYPQPQSQSQNENQNQNQGHNQTQKHSQSQSPAQSAHSAIHQSPYSQSHSHQSHIQRLTESTVFLGESSPLTGVMGPNQPSRLHHALPDRLQVDPTSTRDEAVRLHQVQKAAQLESDGSLAFPPLETTDALLQAYFRWFHPCFPVVERQEIYRARAQGVLSPLLLQAMLFIGVSLCDDATFARTEFPVRYRAKFLFYSRAKAIYEADAEASPTVKLQALFMLSWWRGGPSEERDTRFWLGVAISLAQKRGMHMMSKSHPSPERRLLKRIWWALYVRDQQSAAALGLPPRIRDEDGDVAMLEPDDVRETEAVDDSVFGMQTAQDVVYPVEMVKLARFLRSIVSTMYRPSQAPDLTARTAFTRELCAWEAQLPLELRLDTVNSKTLFLTGLLHLTYQNLYLLLYRPGFINPGTSDDGQIALDAATKSTRIMEDLLSHHLVQHGPTHLITHAFSTLCIHTIHHRRSSGTTRTLAEHRARLCLLSLQELQKSWDLENWVLHLFFRGLDDRTARSLRLSTPPPGEERATEEMIVRKEEEIVQDDWYGWIPGEEEADALNLQNLEFLYRFL